MWEHKIIHLDSEAGRVLGSSYANAEIDTTTLYEDTLDSCGSDGWELVSMMTHPDPKYPDKYVPTAWFKWEVVTGIDVPEPAPPA